MGLPVSRVAQAFGMSVQAWSPNLTPARTDPHDVRAVSKAELFSTSDAITVHVPMSPATRGLVGRHDIARMKADAVLVNTSRAPIVDEEALLEALRGRRIGGYGVDVYESEPLTLDHPYRHLANVVATPHIGYVTQENYQLFFEQSLENLEAFLQGTPQRVIN
jgi:phosphoglycerate dehydrogenase-like enzyme